MSRLSAALAFALWSIGPIAFAGVFRPISIDGDFDDWFGVPVLETSEMKGGGAYDFKDIAFANDDDYLYIRVRLHAPVSYSDFHHDLVFDTDADAGTGHSIWGVGSEVLIENGNSYQQKNGGFNEGGGSDLGWQAAPRSQGDQFEMRVSRNTRDAEGQTVFQGDDLVVSYIAQTLEWQLSDSIEGVPYQFVTEPEPFQGSLTLTDFVDTLWFYQEVADPVVPAWQLPDYAGEVIQELEETWLAANGFFGFGTDGVDYPVDAQAPLTAGRTTYYFRTTFLWEHAGAEGVALLADALVSDGAVMYLNGEEIRRLRMPEGEIRPDTLALGGPESPGAVERLGLPARALTTGENILTVEVHQAAGSMDSLAFGLQLSVSDSVPPSLDEPDKPEDREVVEGESTVFGLGAIAGTEPYAYQWYKDGEAIPDATGARLEIPVVLQEDGGSYEVEVSNASGSTRSRGAILTTTALPLSFLDETIPADQTVLQGRAFTLSAEVQSSPPVTYEWQLNGERIPGATEPQYAVEFATFEDAGEYQLIASNRANSVTSRTAIVTVPADQEAPTIDNITAGSGTVIIAFSEELSDAKVDQFEIAGISIQSATLSEDLQTVTLETEAISFGQVYEVGIKDLKTALEIDSLSISHFESTILIDGDFGDWTGIDPVRTDPDGGDGPEFHQYWVANDGEFLYIRFSFDSVVGPLPVDHYFRIYVDGDNDPATGLNGSSMMIENGGGWLQIGGEFNEGSVAPTGFAMAPQTAAMEFECRLALSTTSQDGVRIFAADAVGLTFELVSIGWATIDAGPADEPINYTLQTFPDLPDAEPDPQSPVDLRSLTIRQLDGQIEIQWNGANLESSDSLAPGSWGPVQDAANPLVISPEGLTRFYRAMRD